MEPIITSPAPPRYTTRSLPPYRYLPFRADPACPHPRTDPAGHSYHAEEEYLPGFAAEDWSGCELYLYGVDLFNLGYWWEAHEAWETIWHAAGRQTTRCGTFIQGLIQLAGAQLKRFLDEPRGAVSLTAAGCGKLVCGDAFYLGIEVGELVRQARRCLEQDRGEFPRIVLHFPVGERSAIEVDEDS